MTSTESNNKKSRLAAYLILLAATAMIIYGYKNNEHKDYYQKAIYICTQCIGLG